VTFVTMIAIVPDSRGGSDATLKDSGPDRPRRTDAIMPRPTTRTELLDASAAKFAALMELSSSLPKAVRDGPFAFEDRDRNLRDVLVHLTAWHRMMLRWYAEGMAGKKPDMPAPGYTWKTTADMNVALWRHAQTVPLMRAMTDVERSHREVMALVEAHTNEELFTRGRYGWTGTSSLGAYLVSATSSHYDWATAKLRKAVRAAQH
jgi:hypothetical protein